MNTLLLEVVEEEKVHTWVGMVKVVVVVVKLVIHLIMLVFRLQPKLMQ